MRLVSPARREAKDKEKIMKEKVEAALDEIRPMLQRDGGDIQLVEVKDNGQVLVRLRGACAGCPGAAMTLKMGVERILKEKVQGITEVVAL
jgi:Fe-S cluster biogenesis protein NfuA